jgi:hypothetical protein
VGQQKEHAMPKSNTAVVTIGIDPGKNTLHLVGLDARGGIVLREKVARAWLKIGTTSMRRTKIGRDPSTRSVARESRSQAP